MICSNPGYPFCTGVTLAKLAAVTMDEQGNETFDASGALDKLRKVSLTSFHEADVFVVHGTQVEILCRVRKTLIFFLVCYLLVISLRYL